MAKIQTLTPGAVDALRSGKMTDPRTPGLTVPVEVNGSKVWWYKRRVSGGAAVVKKALGRYPAFTIADDSMTATHNAKRITEPQSVLEVRRDMEGYAANVVAIEAEIARLEAEQTHQ